MTDDERVMEQVMKMIELAVVPRLDRIEGALDTLLREGSAEAREAMTLARGNAIDIGNLVAWRNRIIGGVMVISIVYGAILAAIGIAMKFI